jgi:predicted ATPase/class 3 adenylate cyclase
MTQTGPLGPPADGLPTGTVTFLRTDVEGSMALARELRERWDAVAAEHLGLVRGSVEDHGGVVVRTEGDAVFAAFPEAGAAVSAAVAAQRALAAYAWPEGGSVRVRMGLHTGEAHLAADDYGGLDVSRAARIAATAHGGQVIVSETTAMLVADRLPAGIGIRDLGRHQVRDVPQPIRLWQLEIPGLPDDFPPPRTAGATPGSLPDRLTSFVGRERELDELKGLIASARLVTLTGPGGIGKSSLAIELARALAPDYPDGAWFVPLDPVEDASHVDAVVARSIGLFDGPERAAADALRPYLAERSVLLVLDNFEHVVDAADRVSSILRSSPASRLIVTSRAPLRIGGEQEYPVPPLAGSAVRLFTERARAVRPGWDPGSELSAVEDVCRLVDALPLGIELAASRVALLPVASIRDRLAARLPLPGTGPRDAPARQRTLDATVAWSHDLLSPALREVLQDVAVFEGGFDAEQAEVLLEGGSTGPGGAIDALAELVDHSLLARDLDGASGIRFRMLTTIQAFALGRLSTSGREDIVRRRHALAYLDLAEQAAAGFQGPELGLWLDRLAIDHANLHAATRWSIASGEVDLALRLVAALWRFWQADGHLNEGRELAESALAMPGTDDASVSLMWATGAGGSLAYWQADPHVAAARYQRQLELAKALDHDPGIADATFNLAHIPIVLGGDPATKERLLREARGRYVELGDESGVARVDWGLANLAMDAGRLDEAQTGYEAVLDRFERLGDTRYHAMTANSLGWIAFLRGDVRGACSWGARGVVESYKARDLGSTTVALFVGVLMAAALGRHETGAELEGAFGALCERYGVRPPGALEVLFHQFDPFAAIRETLPPEVRAAAVDRGHRMTLGEAVAVIAELGDEADRQAEGGGVGGPHD